MTQPTPAAIQADERERAHEQAAIWVRQYADTLYPAPSDAMLARAIQRVGAELALLVRRRR